MRKTFMCLATASAALLCATAAHVVDLHAAPPAEYTVSDVGTLGGSYSFAYSINSGGVVAGGAATPAQTDFVSQTAFVWDGGQPVRVGAVGGATCPDCSSEAAAVSANGQVAVISETASLDPNGEDFCGFGTHRQCVAAAWKNGAFRLLPMLGGGHNSQVYFANSAGEMVGFSETGQADTGCLQPFQQFRYLGVKWSRSGQATPLAPLPGDTVSFAFSMNDAGQAVGASGLCSNVLLPPSPQLTAPHAVFWDADGTPTDLGTPAGGSGTSNTAAGINNLGDVVENSAMADGSVRAFIWNRNGGGLRDLGTYPADAILTVTPCCNVINNRREIVGFSVDAGGNLRALLWRAGAATDLNALLPADSPWYVLQPGGINDAGDIAAVAVNLQTFELHGVMLSPIAGVGPAARGASRPPALPEAVRRRIQPKAF